MCDGRKGSSASATGVGKRRPEAQAIAFEKRMIPSIPTAEEREAGGALEHAGTPIRRSPPSSPHRRDPHRADTVRLAGPPQLNPEAVIERQRPGGAATIEGVDRV